MSIVQFQNSYKLMGLISISCLATSILSCLDVIEAAPRSQIRRTCGFERPLFLLHAKKAHLFSASSLISFPSALINAY